MAYSPEEISERLNSLAKHIAEATPDITQTLALTAIGVIRNRIQETGTDEESVSFPAYSPEYKKRKGKKQGAGAVAYRNLTLSGDMWRKTQIKSTGFNGKNYEVIIGGITQDSQDKINYNAEQIGDFLSVSKEEKANLDEDYDAELDRLIAESGL